MLGKTNMSMYVLMLPNRSFTNASQLIQNSSTDEELNTDFWCFISTVFSGLF